MGEWIMEENFNSITPEMYISCITSIITAGLNHNWPIDDIEGYINLFNNKLDEKDIDVVS